MDVCSLDPLTGMRQKEGEDVHEEGRSGSLGEERRLGKLPPNAGFVTWCWNLLAASTSAVGLLSPFTFSRSSAVPGASSEHGMGVSVPRGSYVQMKLKCISQRYLATHRVSFPLRDPSPLPA